VGTILSMGMEYHVVHHLFPKIPLFQTGPAYWAMRDLLAERGIRNDGL
jgi:beta-carotene hydroxylase